MIPSLGCTLACQPPACLSSFPASGEKMQGLPCTRPPPSQGTPGDVLKQQRARVCTRIHRGRSPEGATEHEGVYRGTQDCVGVPTTNHSILAERLTKWSPLCSTLRHIPASTSVHPTFPMAWRCAKRSLASGHAPPRVCANAHLLSFLMGFLDRRKRKEKAAAEKGEKLPKTKNAPCMWNILCVVP